MKNARCAVDLSRHADDLPLKMDPLHPQPQTCGQMVAVSVILS
jgi:hypothetical protein